ncbi:MAG: hypothetical protein AAGD13_21235 [Pseudomonadota bacterium]
MSEDRSRDPEGGRQQDDLSGLFSERPGGRSGMREPEDAGSSKGAKKPRAAKDADMAEAGARAAETAAMIPASVDEDAVEKHRAAKQARIRKKRREMRQAGETADGEEPQLPAKVRGKGGGGGKKGSALPALRPDIKPDTPALRAERVEAIRRDLVKRRRRKGGTMLLKLWAFVLFPTLLVGYFLFWMASDMYESESKFMVESAEGGGSAAGGLLSSFLGGGGINDPVAVQTYIASRDVLRLLDQDHAWIAHFQAPDLDILNRLDTGATSEDSYEHYQKMVSVSYDPTEGIIEMAVVASDPDSARRFSAAIIGYAEKKVDELSDRVREDAMRDADRNLADAEKTLKSAQLAEAEIRKQQEIFSVETEVATAMSIITGMETELEALSARLTNLRRVTSESDPRVQRIRNQVETLAARIEQRRAAIAGASTQATTTLADANAELVRAQFDVQAAMAIFTSALQAREVARANSARQHRYLSVVSAPSLPDEANYPKKPQMLALAFICFLGFYIIFSLTVSLIREQASI